MAALSPLRLRLPLGLVGALLLPLRVVHLVAYKPLDMLMQDLSLMEPDPCIYQDSDIFLPAYVGAPRARRVVLPV